jgi:outer membrane protein OmpA-like peptidoglycan-associated protein
MCVIGLLGDLLRRRGMMGTFRRARTVCWVAGLVFLGSSVGCARLGLEYAPKRGIAYYPKELPAAERSVESARAAGKDRECPDAFREAEKLKNDAYEIYWSCRTQEAIEKANEATAKANGLCPRVQPAAVPPPLVVPTLAFSASAATIVAGECTTLTWTSANADTATVDQGIGRVSLSGSRQVCPTSTTRYEISAAGPGGSRAASTTVTVNPPPLAPTPVERLTLDINFDLNRVEIRPADRAELQKAIDFVKQHPGRKIMIEGHTDNTGTASYNQGLSERRAAAVKDYLVRNGAVEEGRITSVGYGMSRPIADNATKAGRAQNRRVDIIVLPE